MLAKVAEMAAGQVIDDANSLRPSRQQLIDKRRANERRSTRYKYGLSRPKSVRSSSRARCLLNFHSEDFLNESPDLR